MDLGNLVKTIVHHFLIRGMNCLGYQDEFPMVSTLVYVMHTWQDLQLIMTQDYHFSCSPSLLYCMDSQPWEDIESTPKSIGVLTFGWDPKVVIYLYGLGYCWWRLVTTSILNIGPLGWSKGHVIMKSVVTKFL